MSKKSFTSLKALAAHLRHELQKVEDPKKFILLYAYNGTGKTRLSMAFKDLGKKGEERDTLYFNAYTEDMFAWDNDLEDDQERVLKLNAGSRFFSGLKELELENRIRPLLNRYADFDFNIDYEKFEVRFSREIQSEGSAQIADCIKLSRGEENIFIWCFFLAVVEIAMDKTISAYKWVKYIFIDDPISSLDENNAIAVGHHLAQILDTKGIPIKVVVSTHHSLFFNVLWNELWEIDRKTFAPYFLSCSKKSGEFQLEYTKDTPFFHHLALLQELCAARQTGELYTHHFNALRGLMEKARSFHGHTKFSVCIQKTADDPDETLYGRMLNILSHGNYSYYEPTQMLPETKEHFEKILDDFLNFYPFNRENLASKAGKTPQS